MMRFIFYFLASVAALIMAVDASLSVYHDWKAFKKDAGQRQENARNGVVMGGDAQRVSTLDPESVFDMTFWLYDVGEDEETVVKKFSVVPVYIQNLGEPLKPLIRDILFYTADYDLERRPNGLLQRPCTSRYMETVIIYDHSAQKAIALFNEDDSVITYISKTDAIDNAEFLFIEYVTSDTDGDGVLSCNDFRRLAVYDPLKDKIARVDLKDAEPILNYNSSIIGRANIIGLGVDENGDGLHDRTREKVLPAAFNPETMSFDILNPEAEE